MKKTLDQLKKSSETIVLEKKQLNKIVGGTTIHDTAKSSISNVR
nr:hypothetical protein [uncultured Flavobacterium sp.]